jgi:hypothetical protein
MRDVGGEQAATDTCMRDTMRRLLLSAFGLLVTLLVAACGRTTPALPQVQGGTYTSSAYHFSITYPDGWRANELPGATSSAAIPLTVTITRTGDNQAQSAVVSAFTITVLNARNTAVVASYAALAAQAAKNKDTLTHTTIAGQPAVEVQSPPQQVLGSTTQATHTDYYVMREDYEYQLSTDAVDGDGAEPALQAMLQSFTLMQ